LSGKINNMISNVNQKTKEQLLEEFSQHTSHNTLEGEQYTAAIIVKSASDIEASAKDVGQRITNFLGVVNEINISLNNLKDVIKTNNDSSEKLSRKLFWLNVILASATVIGAVATAILAIPVIVNLFK